MIAKILPEPHRSVLIASGNNCLNIARVISKKGGTGYSTDTAEYKKAAQTRDDVIATLHKATGGKFQRYAA